MPVSSRPIQIDGAADTGGDAFAMALDVDKAIEPLIAETLTALDGRSALLAGMVRYHLGYANADFSPAPDRVRIQSRGKRLRPAVAMLACAALGRDPNTAAPIAVAIELLHNFTLIHDDIQDKSETRRHRPTVWNLWGVEQAINAGDALFAASQLPILHLTNLSVAPETVIELVGAFNRMTIEIVEGQVLDLSFEGNAAVTADDYLTMIAGKTAAIVQFAARSGAILGGASSNQADRFAEFGLALGLGYQIRDDVLGVWGAPEVTGKASADDIRRRKQSLPIVLLRERMRVSEVKDLERIYREDPIGEAGVTAVLSMLDRHGIANEAATRVAGYHTVARAALEAAVDGHDNPAVAALFGLTARLASRDS